MSYFNLGISLELMRKFLFAGENMPISKDHGRARLCGGLTLPMGTRIEREYGTLALNDLALQAFAFARGPQLPPSPTPRTLHMVDQLFNYFDEDVRLRSKKYEWEEMNTPEWRHYLSEVHPFTRLVERLMRGFIRL